MRGIGALVFVLWVHSTAAATYQDVERIVAFGDVHGAYEPLEQLLQAIELVDSDNHWIGGSTHLVSVGDLVDRGPESRRVMDLLRGLQQQALDAGGRVHVLLGNHEVMNLTGELRDVSAEEFAAFADPDEVPDEQGRIGVTGHRAAFALTGEYGAWLSQLPTLVKINDTLFTHGGVSTALAGLSIANVNEQSRAAIIAAVESKPDAEAAPDVHPLLSWRGPFWYRGNAWCHSLLEEPGLTQVLDGFGAARVVVGHTPTPTRQPMQRFDGKAVFIDTGMLKSVYRGAPWALEIVGNEIRALGIDETRTTLAALTQGLGEQETRSLKRKAAKLELAAYKLDRLLGLEMVPEVEHTEHGTIQYLPTRRISETERQTSGQHRPNQCAVSSAYELLAVFDALIGMLRDGETLQYHQPTWRIIALDHANAFGTQKSIPTYTRQPHLNARLAASLKSLDEAKLQALLGEELSRRQIRALLARRDAILAWEVSEAAEKTDA